MKKYIITLILLLQSLFYSVYAQPQYKFENISINEGLVSNYPNYILFDSYDYLWIGTQDGLNRYDGNTYELYTQTEDKLGLNNSYIIYLFEDLDKELWIGTLSGLNKYDRLKNKIYNYNLPEKSNLHEVNTAVQTSDSIIWFGTYRGICKYNKHKHTCKWFDSKNYSILKDTLIMTLCYDSIKNNIWIGTNKEGIYKLDLQTEQIQSLQELSGVNQPTHLIKRIKQSPDGKIWVATYNKGVLIIDPDTYALTILNKEKNNLGNNLVFDICFTKKGETWVSCINGYANLYDPLTNQFYNYIPDDSDPYSINGHSIITISEDKYHNLWFGTHGDGLDFLGRESQNFKYKIQNNNDKTQLNNRIVNAFAEYNNELWVATDGGGINIYNIDKNKIIAYITNKEGLGSNFVTDIKIDSSGIAYVASWQGGLTIINANTKRVVKNIKSKFESDNEVALSNDVVKTLCIDDSLVWIAIQGYGINIYNTKRDEIITAESPQNNFFELTIPVWTNSIIKDSKGQIWIASTQGLFLYNKSGFHSFSTRGENNIFTDNIISVYEDSEQRILICTELGIGMFNEKDSTFINQNLKLNIPNNSKSLVEDKNGDFWVSTNNGLYKLNNDFTESIKYSKRNGLLSDFYLPNSAYKTNNNFLVFGGINGFNIFHPDSVKRTNIKKQVSLQKIFLNNVEVSPSDSTHMLLSVLEFTDTIVLQPQHSEFEIIYSYTAPENKNSVHYAIRLLGFNENWKYVEDRTSVNYTNLDPGTYTFQVAIYENNTIIEESISDLTVIILPPWWKTWWFRILFFIATISLISLIFYVRVLAIRKHNFLLKKEVKIRTSELSEANAMLKEQNEETLLQNEKLEEYNAEIIRQSSKILKQQEEIVYQKNELEKNNKELPVV